MSTSKPKHTSIFRSDKVRKLLEGKTENLNEDERALLLALLSVDAEAIDDLSDEEREALKDLGDQLDSYDPEEVARAVKHLITAKSRQGPKLKWPKLPWKKLVQ